MRRDLVIGIIVSLLVNGGIYEYGELTKKGPPKAKPKEEETIQIIEMPKIEPEEEEVIDDAEKPPPQDFAPPMQQDVPQPVLDTSFVRPLQPPPPENMQILKGQIIVPQGGTSWRSGIKIFDVSQLDQIPLATFSPSPTYPFAMRREGITGQVVVEFIVDSTGEVHDAFAFSSTQHEFEAAAVSAIMKWRFKPGRKDGHVVITRHMQIPIDFKLDDN